MKDFKLFPILNNDVTQKYDVEISEDVELNEDQVRLSVRHAKLGFKIPGKMFLLVAEDQVYFVSKLGAKKDKYWKVVKIL